MLDIPRTLTRLCLHCLHPSLDLLCGLRGGILKRQTRSDPTGRDIRTAHRVQITRNENEEGICHYCKPVLDSNLHYSAGSSVYPYARSMIRKLDEPNASGSRVYSVSKMTEQRNMREDSSASCRLPSRLQEKPQDFRHVSRVQRPVNVLCFCFSAEVPTTHY